MEQNLQELRAWLHTGLWLIGLGILLFTGSLLVRAITHIGGNEDRISTSGLFGLVNIGVLAAFLLMSIGIVTIFMSSVPVDQRTVRLRKTAR